MSVSLLQPYFFMSKTKSYAQILIGSRLFLTAMFLVPINKTSPFSSLFRNRYRNWCFFYFVYVSDWGVSGKAYVGYLSGVGCSFNFCIHLVPYLPGCTAFSKASCRTGSYFNPCWTDRYTNNKVSSQLVEYIASTWEH
jgi:hypothetical protein